MGRQAQRREKIRAMIADKLWREHDGEVVRLGIP